MPKMYKKAEKEAINFAKNNPKEAMEQLNMDLTKPYSGPPASEDWSQAIRPKTVTPQEKAVANLNQNLANKAEQKAAVEERKEILKNPEAAAEKMAKEQMNAMTTAVPQEKKEEEKAKEPEKKEEEAKTEEKKEEEEAVRVRKQEISASEAKKLIEETEAREKQKKELEEKAKKALEGGNK